MAGGVNPSDRERAESGELTPDERAQLAALDAKIAALKAKLNGLKMAAE